MTNIAVALRASGSIKSGSVEFSPDGQNWLAVSSASFSPLAYTLNGPITSVQFTANPYRYMRVQAWASGSAGALTSSVEYWITGNNG